MADLENELPLEDELEPEAPEGTEPEAAEEDPEPEVDRYAELEAKVTALATQNSKLIKDFNSAVGRYQSLMDKLESGRGDTDKLVQQVNSSVGAVEQVLDTILNDESVDPELRRKAAEVRSRTKAETDLATMKAELEALKTQRVQTPPVADTEELSPLEDMLNRMIVAAGFHPTRDFDWAEAGAVFNRDGEEAVIAYFTNKIIEKKTEASATNRRQARKTDASKTPSPASATRNPEDRLGDESLSLDERLATLRSMIANRV
jgi:hypothetical protein